MPQSQVVMWYVYYRLEGWSLQSTCKSLRLKLLHKLKSYTKVDFLYILNCHGIEKWITDLKVDELFIYTCTHTHVHVVSLLNCDTFTTWLVYNRNFPPDLNPPSLWAIRNKQPCDLRENAVQQAHISQNSLPDWLVNSVDVLTEC